MQSYAIEAANLEIQRFAIMAHKRQAGGPHPLDVVLGQRIRLRRKELHMSQTQLAKASNVTFQQIQKYERGTNRISFSRLTEFSAALNCSLSDLIGDLDALKSIRRLSNLGRCLAVRGAGDLVAAYAKIPSVQSRRVLLTLARQVANSEREADHASFAKKKPSRSDASMASR